MSKGTFTLITLSVTTYRYFKFNEYLAQEIYLGACQLLRCLVFTFQLKLVDQRLTIPNYEMLVACLDFGRGHYNEAEDKGKVDKDKGFKRAICVSSFTDNLSCQHTLLCLQEKIKTQSIMIK